MGTETKLVEMLFEEDYDDVKLNNPLMGTETLHNLLPIVQSTITS